MRKKSKIMFPKYTPLTKPINGFQCLSYTILSYEEPVCSNHLSKNNDGVSHPGALLRTLPLQVKKWSRIPSQWIRSEPSTPGQSKEDGGREPV